MSNLFQNLEIEAFRAGINPRTDQSRDWFRKRVQRMRGINRLELVKEEGITISNEPIIGSMSMFFYDPKYKDTLPFYDRFPLAVIVGPAPGGFHGLNLHYLPPILRAKMLDGLMDITNNKAYDETTRFRLSYSLLNRLSKLKYYKPCYKHYLRKHMKSRFSIVSAPEWEIATFLPTQDFAKASTSAVYSASRRAI